MEIVVAVVSLGVAAIFAAGMWLVIETERKATKLREEQERRRSRKE